MKSVQQLKQQIYNEVENSGFLKNVQAQVKAHVLEIIDKETKGNKDKLGFQYEHPVLKKLRNYPLTSICMDLIQEFLESFKFKHTLNVFKKQISRDLTISRQNLSKQFSIDLSGKDQSVLLSIVGQIVNGDVKIIDRPRNQTAPLPKQNNFMGDDGYNKNTNNKTTAQDPKRKTDPFSDDYGGRQNNNKAPEKDIKQPTNKKYEIPETNKQKQEKLKQQQRKQQQQRKKIQQEKQKQIERQKEIQRQKQLEKQKELQKQKEKEKEKKGGKGKKNKKQEEKPPEGASDLLANVVGKFDLPKNNKKSEQEQFKARKAYSQQKQPKKIVAQQSGTNKIRGISMGKIANSSSGMGTLNSFMKFSSFNNQPTKNESIQQQFDELQQSKDSTRRNPLYSSSESGFDKSNGYDQSVDSNAIEEYEYYERAKKFTKKN